MGKKIKPIVFIVLILIIIVSVKSILKGGGKDAMKDKGISYRIVKKEDISVGSTKRYLWSVVVDEQIKQDNLKDLSKEIIEDAKKEIRFNAISINFFDYEEYIGSVYTLGQVEYAPEGDWAKANSVKTGEYKKMDYKFSIMEKDWDKQLTKEEVEIYQAWNKLHKEKADETDFPDEDEISKEISDMYDIEVKEVEDILTKQLTWAFDNKDN